VRGEDAPLVRAVAAALADPARAAAAARAAARALRPDARAQPEGPPRLGAPRRRRARALPRHRARRRPVTWLVDTNVISEVRKGPRCHPGVAAWWAGVEDRDLFLSALTLGEIRKGVEGVRPRDPAKAAALEGWLAEVAGAFGPRVLRVDLPVAKAWGRIRPSDPSLSSTRWWPPPPACTAWCSSPATPRASRGSGSGC
jgi:predicted nucleic acid-binding protein